VPVLVQVMYLFCVAYLLVLYRRSDLCDEDKCLLVPLLGQLGGTLTLLFPSIQGHVMVDKYVPLHRSLPVQARIAVGIFYKGASDSVCTNKMCLDNTRCHQPSSISDKQSIFFGATIRRVQQHYVGHFLLSPKPPSTTFAPFICCNTSDVCPGISMSFGMEDFSPKYSFCFMTSAY
jgi:hypothetical protein